jgi:hypothetical protein
MAMTRRERERIMRQGVVLPETPRQRRDLEGLAQDLVDHPLAGKPLRRRYRNFTPDAGHYLASLGGPRPYMARLREIDRQTAEHERKLAKAYAEHGADEAGWTVVAAGWNFTEVNELIDRHNRWFPVESRLPLDPRTGDYVLVNGGHYGKRPLDATWVLERFPAGRANGQPPRA